MLLLVLDGMRPQSIQPRLMPNLARLAAGGVTYTRSRTGFPSETMVGAGELFTGAYPETSGITSNWMHVPGAPLEGVEIKTLAGIQQVAAAHGGRALLGTTLFEALRGAGLTSAVIGKEGPAELAHVGGATWTVSSGGAHETADGRRIGAHRGAPALEQLIRGAAGDAPESGEADNSARSRWLATSAAAVDAALAPDLLTVWFTDPDKTQHEHGLGTVNQRRGLRAADAQIGRLLTTLAQRGELADMDVIVTSDHGFSDHLERPDLPLAETLRAAGLTPVNVDDAGNQHIVRFDRPPTPRDFARIRAAIAASPFAHLVETVIENPRRAPRGDGRGDARLTGRDLRTGSDRAGDVYIVYRRDDHGVPGPRKRGGRGPGHVPAGSPLAAGHGSLGWSDLHNTLVVAGPSFDGRAAAGSAPVRTPNAAGIFDVAPTILHLFGLQSPQSMQGRVLREALAEGGVGDGAVAALQSRRSTAWADVLLGARRIRTGLETEELPDGSAYFVGLHSADA